MWWNKICKLWEYTIGRGTHLSALGRAWVHDRGQSLVEFAIILPVLLLLVVGIIDLGMGFKTYMGLTNAAREGVRWITIHPSDRIGAEFRIATESDRIGVKSGVLVEGGYDVRFTPNKLSYAAGEKVTVSVDYDYEMLFGTITNLPRIAFTASSTMVVLYDK